MPEYLIIFPIILSWKSPTMSSVLIVLNKIVNALGLPKIFCGIGISAFFMYMIGYNITLCLLGIIVCAYAIKVEEAGMSETKKHGKVLKSQGCDVDDEMSCSLVFSSEYSHMAKKIFNLDETSFFNWSNAHYGLVFYIGLFIFNLYPFTLLPFHSGLFLLGTTGSVFASLGLAYILKYILHNFCMICVGMYIINFLLFFSSLSQFVWG